ncbi:complex I subunit 4 family protein [Bythopirellula polymerisocia]|uniref:NADH-quinone oxidoreductase subunit M n=1 Tax=Bythopirellula polymerisocia TaxID=2528003 RepID=A0A5C6CPA3_9BACT|nr:NADH-quinone oxidoreductase subunit M [Bythopirellula polymerisocia]TWU25875.1 NADH-quinone oxidoreductase subunit M [Bythopirellula polymerisocia]
MTLSDPKVYLSLLVFLPAVAALVLAVLPRLADESYKLISLAVTIFVFILTLGFFRSGAPIDFEAGVAEMQNLFNVDWIPSFGIQYFMAMDGISFPLVVLTAFLSVLAMGASWPITKHVKGYCILFLLLETGMLGVFMALDFFLFYVFWEVMLLPMYFLIGVWGGPRREYAAIKFFLYTLVGSVLMLIAILMLYFNSDLTRLDAQQLADAGIVSVEKGGDAAQSFEKWKESDLPLAQRYAEITKEADLTQRKQLHTFNILALQQMGQHTDLFDGEALWGKSTQWWAFLLLFIGFVIKVPSVPLHTWLPDAHVEAPTPISMILAGILLKMGGYGLIRICYPICPNAGYQMAYFVCFVGVLSMVYGAFAALAQKDFKRMVAYSSVSHMGYVVLGLGVWSAVADTGYNPDYWKMGANGAMFQMIAHGISSAGMFFMVGVIYDRVHHRDLDKFGGLFAKMPLYSGLAVGIFFAGLGLPGLCGFIGEVFVVLSVWKYSYALAIISAAVVILTAGYILWAIQRVYLGAEYKGPHGEAITPITMRELSIAVPLLVLAIVFGVYPTALLNYMQPSVDMQIDRLAVWTEEHDNRATASNPLGSQDGQVADAWQR